MYLELCVRSWRYCCRIVRASSGLGQLGLAKSRPLRERFRGHSIGTPVLKSLWPFRIAYFCSFSKATAYDTPVSARVLTTLGQLSFPRGPSIHGLSPLDVNLVARA